MTEFIRTIDPVDPLQDPKQLISCGCAVPTRRRFLCVVPGTEDDEDPKGIYQCRGCETTVTIPLSTIDRMEKWKDLELEERVRVKEMRLNKCREKLELTFLVSDKAKAADKDKIWSLAVELGWHRYFQNLPGPEKMRFVDKQHKLKLVWRSLRIVYTEAAYEEIAGLVN